MTAPVAAVSILTKTYVTLPLVFLALIEFFTAMHVFGNKGAKWGAKPILLLHRICGYLFLVWWLWPIWVGFGLLGSLSDDGTGWRMGAREFYHAFLGVAVLLLLLLKIAFVRLYRNYRQQARLLGIVITLCALATWAIAGWFWLAMMASPVVGD